MDTRVRLLVALIYSARHAIAAVYRRPWYAGTVHTGFRPITVIFVGTLGVRIATRDARRIVGGVEDIITSVVVLVTRVVGALVIVVAVNRRASLALACGRIARLATVAESTVVAVRIRPASTATRLYVAVGGRTTGAWIALALLTLAARINKLVPNRLSYALFSIRGLAAEVDVLTVPVVAAVISTAIAIVAFPIGHALR